MGSLLLVILIPPTPCQALFGFLPTDRTVRNCLQVESQVIIRLTSFISLSSGTTILHHLLSNAWKKSYFPYLPQLSNCLSYGRLSLVLVTHHGWKWKSQNGFFVVFWYIYNFGSYFWWRPIHFGAPPVICENAWSDSSPKVLLCLNLYLCINRLLHTYYYWILTILWRRYYTHFSEKKTRLKEIKELKGRLVLPG